MFRITRHFSPPDYSTLQQIVAIVIADAESLSMAAVPASNPLSSIHDLVLALEINAYIEAVGRNDELHSGLIVATDGSVPGRVMGFLVFQGLVNVPEGCGINYMAVVVSDRRKGVARAMVQEVVNSYPHATLTCPISKVPFYEGLGFTVVGARHNQVRMNTSGFSTSNIQNVLNAEAFLRHPQVVRAQQGLIQKHGPKVLRDAEKQIQREVSRASKRASIYVQERLAAIQN